MQIVEVVRRFGIIYQVTVTAPPNAALALPGYDGAFSDRIGSGSGYFNIY